MRILRLLVVTSCMLSFSFAQDAEIKSAPGKAPNSNALYQQLKALALTGDAVDVSNLVIKREIATITLEAGTVQFTPAVNGVVTGAAFVGKGKIAIAPTSAVERNMLGKLTRGAPYEESFSSLVLRFTDGTDKEIKASKSSVPSSAPKGSSEYERIRKVLREDLNYNLNGRILDDLLTGKGGLFFAFINGSDYGSKQVFDIDPYDEEEISYYNYDENKSASVSERLAATAAAGDTVSHKQFHSPHHSLTTQIEKSGRLSGSATASYIVDRDVQVLDLSLFSSLRVDSVTYEDGTSLDFIQESEKADPDFYIILPATKHAGDKFRVNVTYAGKNAVSNEGGGNYYPVARSTWYPTLGMGHYATYDLTFRIPKKHKMAATGVPVSDSDQGDWNVSTWKVETPQSVAGFSFGKFKSQQVKLDKEGYVITAYANEDQPNWVASIQQQANEFAEGAALGTMSTIPLLKRNLAEAQVAMQIYTSAYGPVPYKNLAVTQQTACDYGQSWPGLVYLPVCAFFDSTVRHTLGLDDDRGYWEVVEPHEVAHQWWGQLVGFDNARDQWMSEGFADFSASVYLQKVYDNNKYSKFWKDELDLLTEKNKEGARAIDVGPVTMGYRLGSNKTGWDIPRRLIYPKGAFILHMLRMMMADRQTGDQKFNAMMRDFATTYANHTATTEDFKAMVEKHMLPSMNLTQNGKMDWFFNEYVYGTALPTYHFESSFGEPNNGSVRMHIKLTQSGVPKDFMMTVPVYLELANGGIARLGLLGINGDSTFEQDVDLPLQQKPKRAMINYYYDVLSLNN